MSAEQPHVGVPSVSRVNCGRVIDEDVVNNRSLIRWCDGDAPDWIDNNLFLRLEVSR